MGMMGAHGGKQSIKPDYIHGPLHKAEAHKKTGDSG